MRPLSQTRLLAMGWFFAFAFLTVTILFHPLSITFRALFLFFALPAISGGIAGYCLGAAILDRDKTVGYAKAIFRGVGVALVACVIFFGLFSLFLPLVETGWAVKQAEGLFLATMIFGPVMGGPFAVLSGGIAGASLYWCARSRI